MVAYIRTVGGEHVTALNNRYALSPSSAKLASGDYLNVWFDSASNDSGATVHAARFDANGNQVGAESVFAITPRAGESATITALTTGGFAITWYNGAVTEQLFAANGNKIGGDIALGQLGPYDLAPSASALANGGVAVTWGTGGDIGGKAIDAAGTVVSSILLDTGGFENEPRIVGLAGGGFALVWTDQSGKNGDPNIGLLGQMFDSAGQKLGNPFVVNTATAGAEYAASLAALGDGGFVATWTENGPNDTNSGGIRAQRFDASGAKVGGEIVVNDLTPNYQAQSSVIALPFGGYLVTWEDYTRLDGDINVPSIRAQLFDSDGTRLGDTIRVNTQTQHAESRPVLTLESPTTALMTWRDNGGADDGSGTVHVAIDLPAFGTNGADALVATRLDETLLGRGGDDVLIGNGGANIMDGGAGHDAYVGGAGDDIFIVDGQEAVFENANEGSDGVIAGANYYLYANIEKLTLAAGAGDIFGVGNELANTIAGNEGANTLLGGAGDDVVHGGGGVDILYGQDGTDQLFGDAGNDVAVGGAGNDMIDGGDGGDSLYGEDGNDTLWGGTDSVFDQLAGGAGDDVLHGDSGWGDFDYLIGNAGDDSYYVDTYADLVFENAGEGTDTVYANIPGNGYYLYENIENLVLIGNTAYGVGNALDNHITGSAAANWLLGGAGNDVLNGKGGNDVLFGEAGADTFVFEPGTQGDTIGDFTAGTDRIDLSAFGFTSFEQVQAAMSENGGSTAIVLGGGDFIVLQGVANAALHIGDFVLATQQAAQDAGLDDGHAAPRFDPAPWHSAPVGAEMLA